MNGAGPAPGLGDGKVECGVCDVRSSMGYCLECRKLLCETCAVVCDNCAKPICPDHVNLTQGGRNLCYLCFEERALKRAEHEQRHHHPHRHSDDDTGDTSLSGLLAKPEKPPPDEDDDDAPTVRSYQPTRPWQICLYIAGLGLVVMLLLLAIPGLRQVPLGGGRSFPGVYAALVVPVIGLMWGVSSFMNPEEIEHQLKSLGGIVASMAAIGLGFVVLYTDPVRTLNARPIPIVEMRDENMGERELDEWRQDMLKRFRPPETEEATEEP